MTQKKVAVKPKKRVSVNLWKKVKEFLFVENKFTEGDIHDMVELWKTRKTTEETIQGLIDGNTQKLQTIAIKDNIISDLTNEISGKDEMCKHHREFQDKLSAILTCPSEPGEILASVVTAIGNESKLVSKQSELTRLRENIDNAIKEGVDKATYELRLRLATTQGEINRLERDVIAYEKKIDILSLGKTTMKKPFFLRLKKLLRIK